MRWLVLLLVSGCVSLRFHPSEGAPTDLVGEGGPSETVAGVDIWEGIPPRRFRVLGFIEDSHAAGVAHLRCHKRELAEASRTVGGDAIVFIDERSLVYSYATAQELDRPTLEIPEHLRALPDLAPRASPGGSGQVHPWPPVPPAPMPQFAEGAEAVGATGGVA